MRFLDRMDPRSVPRARRPRDLDNSSTHKTPAIQRWLLRHPRFHLHFTPTYSSWLNLVERWFAELTTKWLGGAPTPVAELEHASRTRTHQPHQACVDQDRKETTPRPYTTKKNKETSGAVRPPPAAPGRRPVRRSGVGLDLGHRLGHQLLGLLQVAAPQRQLGQASKQRPGVWAGIGSGSSRRTAWSRAWAASRSPRPSSSAARASGTATRRTGRAGLQGPPGDLLGLVPAAQGEQRLGGVGGQHRPGAADQAKAAGLLDAVEGDHGRLLPAAGGVQSIGAVDERAQHEDHVAGLGGQPSRRRQLGEPGVGLAEVVRALPRVAWAVASSARAPTCSAMAMASSAGPPGLREAVHHHQVLCERAEHPRPLHRRLGRHQPHRLLVGVQRGGVTEPAQAAGQLLVQ